MERTSLLCQESWDENQTGELLEPVLEGHDEITSPKKLSIDFDYDRTPPYSIPTL